jgi:NAD(P)-dependent dehydrogenase (short-subunit alcohol dehydrogenase family)
MQRYIAPSLRLAAFNCPIVVQIERLGQPEDIVNLVSFLAGPDGGWVNGQVLRANGGFA